MEFDCQDHNNDTNNDGHAEEDFQPVHANTHSINFFTPMPQSNKVSRRQKQILSTPSSPNAQNSRNSNGQLSPLNVRFADISDMAESVGMLFAADKLDQDTTIKKTTEKTKSHMRKSRKSKRRLHAIVSSKLLMYSLN